jgi:hypothetical protein
VLPSGGVNPELPPHIALDTSEEADAKQLDAYRRLGGTGRVAVVFRLNALVRQTARAGIRRRHPSYDDRQVGRALQRLLFGDALARSLSPDEELVDP